MQSILLGKTRSYYDQFPFIEGGLNRVNWWREYLRDFLSDDDIHDRLIVDVGSSVGEISRGLVDRGARMACLDLSLQSLLRCRHINPEAQTFHGNALELPFPDGTFDHAISIGVLHHTPDCRRGFKEVARVTAPGGTVIILLYNYWSIYNLVYHAFKPIRAILPLNRIPRWMLGFLQPFVKIHLGQTLTKDQLRNLLGDTLWTPQATFHSVSEVCRWGIEEGLTLVSTRRFCLSHANVMKFQKRGRLAKTSQYKVLLKCLRCGDAPMKKNGVGFTCLQCNHKYGIYQGITQCLT